MTCKHWMQPNAAHPYGVCASPHGHGCFACKGNPSRPGLCVATASAWADRVRRMKSRSTDFRDRARRYARFIPGFHGCAGKQLILALDSVEIQQFGRLL